MSDISDILNSIKGNGASPEELDTIVAQYLLIATAMDGILYDEQKANNPDIPCHGFHFTKANGTEGTWATKPGIIGALSEEQVATYCTKFIPLKSSGLEQRIKTFQAASEQCEGESIEDRIVCMSKALHASPPS